ncbi:FYN-binding protein 2 isoform X2 [Sciurus carolinensis]|uniref:FYN-binding protein 2 isoform X2 n=1 Tax=Sciurus carolinensis TaxID=30640 RepID=UPI001FB3F052|nr:FYN-binding protein 2 isoform X2 [Sciurus carolinensis]
MEEEGVRNFKELRAKFQKFDAPTLPGPIKFPAGVSQKGDLVCTRPIQILAKEKPLSSNHSQLPPHSCSGEFRPHKTQKTNVAQRSETQKSSSSPGPPAKSHVCSAGKFQKASLLLDVTGSNTENTTKERVMTSSSFRDKLRNWEKVSSQKNETSSALLLADCEGKAFHLEGQKGMGLVQEKPRKKLETKGAQTLPSQRHLMAQRKSLTTSKDSSSLLSPGGWKSQEIPGPERNLAGSTCQAVYECELANQAPVSEKQPDIRHHQFPKTRPLPSIESLGPPPPKPSKPPSVNLQVFQRQPASIAKTPNEVTIKEGCPPPESAEFEEPHNYEATISYRRHSGNSINLCTAKEIADSTYEVGIEELQKPWKSFLHQELSPKHEDPDRRTKESEPHMMEKDPHANNPSKVDVCEGAPAKIQMTRIHGGRGSMPDGKQETVTDILQTKICPEDMKLASHSEGQSGYVEALEVTGETPGPGAFKSSPLPEETYDDVEYPRTDVPKLDFSSSFTSDSENCEEIYEDIYKTKSNYPKIDLDGKEALKRLQQFFRKEKGRFKMKKTKSKENVSAFSISLPDLELRSQDVIIYDDVDISEKESKDEDKMKTWKPKFLIPKGKKEKKGADGSERCEHSFSPRKFFRTKKQNLEKNRMGREEKLFRERFQYDKEIIVINRAVACSSNSRNGIFDLPITPGEELEVIDTTEQNLVICRNSKGKYGYVLIEHLDFKHQDWSR